MLGTLQGPKQKYTELQADVMRNNMVPKERIAAKMDYFYGPYNTVYGVNQCMTFDELSEDQKWGNFCNLLQSMESNQIRHLGHGMKLANHSPRKKLLNQLETTAPYDPFSNSPRSKRKQRKPTRTGTVKNLGKLRMDSMARHLLIKSNSMK